VKGEDGLR